MLSLLHELYRIKIVGSRCNQQPLFKSSVTLIFTWQCIGNIVAYLISHINSTYSKLKSYNFLSHYFLLLNWYLANIYMLFLFFLFIWLVRTLLLYLWARYMQSSSRFTGYKLQFVNEIIMLNELDKLVRSVGYNDR